VFGFFISLHKWNPLQGNIFIGFDGYLELFKTPRFWNSFFVTWRFVVFVIPGIIIVGLGAALILQSRPFTGNGMFEAFFFFPYLLNVSIVSILWGLLHDPDIGILFHALKNWGVLTPLLNDEFWAIPAVAFATIWWLSGYRMIVFRASLASLPRELYEAAKLDGSGPMRTFFSVTLPLLKPTLLFALVLTTVGGMRTFGQIILMTSGGPGTSSEVLALYMYRNGFEFLDFGKAAAVGFILFLMIFTVSMVFVRVFRLDSEMR
jgi:ABC-type sugar transport system permease subunit